MEFLFFLVAWVTIGNPEWLGKHLAKAEAWRDYYRKQARQDLRREIARRRLKRIRRQYPDAFRRN